MKLLRIAAGLHNVVQASGLHKKLQAISVVQASGLLKKLQARRLHHMPQAPSVVQASGLLKKLQARRLHHASAAVVALLMVVPVQAGENPAGGFGSSLKAGMSKVTSAFSSNKPPSEPRDPISLDTKSTTTAELHVAAGRLAEQASKPQEAEWHYEQALRLNQNHLPALVSYARFKDRQAKFTEATELYQRAARVNPNEASVFNDLGICFARRNMLGEATAALRRAVELEPDGLLYRNNLATVLVETGNVDAAFTEFRAVHSEAAAYYNLGYLLEKKGDKKGAARLFAEAVRKDPSLVEAQIWLDRLTAELQPPAAANASQYAVQAPAPPSRPTVSVSTLGQNVPAYESPSGVRQLPAVTAQPSLAPVPYPRLAADPRVDGPAPRSAMRLPPVAPLPDPSAYRR